MDSLADRVPLQTRRTRPPVPKGIANDMSGVEVVGLLASVAQLAHYGLKIATSISEIYRRVRDAPLKIQHYTEQISQLIELARFIERREWFQNVKIGAYIYGQVNITLSQARALFLVLDQLRTERTQGLVRKYWKALNGSKEKEILAHFERLEKEKSALQLCIVLCHTELLDNLQSSVDGLSRERSPDSATMSPPSKLKKMSRKPVCSSPGTVTADEIDN